MRKLQRRQWLTAAAATTTAAVLPDLSFLAPLSRAVAADPHISPDQVRQTPDSRALVSLIRSTPREECVPAFVAMLQAGLSYQDLLTGLFLATLENGDPHQVAAVYSAHRLSCQVSTEERLLPMFWALDRICGGIAKQETSDPTETANAGIRYDQAVETFRKAMESRDHEGARRSIVAIGRTHGMRSAHSLLWEYSARRAAGTLGHHPIMAANSGRTLDAIGWQHAEPVVRYLAGSFVEHDSDRTFEPNRERAAKSADSLPADWAVNAPNRTATLELYALLRDGKTDECCDLACQQLVAGDAQAGALWDAVHLVAADLLYRFRFGSVEIGGYLIHCVTSTNALRFGFECERDDRVRLLLFLQAIGELGDLFIQPNLQEGKFRKLDLLELSRERDAKPMKLADVFAMLPKKGHVPPTDETSPERRMSDDACRLGFTLLHNTENQAAFRQTALSLLCVKATENPHDLKYPVAAFEDVACVSTEWRPYLLAASLHALHGSASNDAPVLVKAREAMRS